MLLPFLLLGGKMNNCQLFTLQVNEIEFYCKYAKNNYTTNRKGAVRNGQLPFG